MAIFQAILGILKALPAIIDAIKSAIGWLKEVTDNFQDTKKLRELSEALKDAKTNKSSKKLQDIISGVGRDPNSVPIKPANS